MLGDGLDSLKVMFKNDLGELWEDFMQLVLRRSQKSTGIMSKTVVFCLDARADYSAEEKSNISKYKLGGQIVYSSAAAEANMAKAAVGLAGGGGFLKGAVALAMAKLSLNISVDSLAKGQHIECKDLEELLAAEEAIKSACETIRAYLMLASTFDGREIVVDLTKELVPA